MHKLQFIIQVDVLRVLIPCSNTA